MGAGFWSPVIVSLQVVSVASVIAFLLAMLASWFMTRKSFKGKVVVETILMLPLVLPPTVIGFGLLVLLGRQSWIGRAFEWLFSQPLVFSYWAAVTAAVVVAFPLVYQMLQNGFEGVDRELEQAARQMGAKEYQLFWYVTLPLAWRAVVTGFMLGFARGLGEFGATLMFAGNIPGRTQTMSTAIFVAVESGHMMLAYYWVGSIMVFSFFLLLFVQRLK
ncbi:molybdate ABC transporter permease subunit [Alkalihalobacillus oceani]|uniref:Molybdenum transport system permease n=1 Tax=Halalkalibacter oceani TaxID=1653776 RepID=A0A9X2DMG8_9BACI|nr:molybdate ABC transporter permease subunit [Halalkalibacter oceani]MCM3712750.1 molybdate ABC transporter permease subunit [Halalkalibacter oceani]